MGDYICPKKVKKRIREATGSRPTLGRYCRKIPSDGGKKDERNASNH